MIAATPNMRMERTKEQNGQLHAIAVGCKSVAWAVHLTLRPGERKHESDVQNHELFTCKPVDDWTKSNLQFFSSHDWPMYIGSHMKIYSSYMVLWAEMNNKVM